MSILRLHNTCTINCITFALSYLSLKLIIQNMFKYMCYESLKLIILEIIQYMFAEHVCTKIDNFSTKIIKANKRLPLDRKNNVHLKCSTHCFTQSQRTRSSSDDSDHQIIFITQTKIQLRKRELPISTVLEIQGLPYRSIPPARTGPLSVHGPPVPL